MSPRFWWKWYLPLVTRDFDFFSEFLFYWILITGHFKMIFTFIQRKLGFCAQILPFLGRKFSCAWQIVLVVFDGRTTTQNPFALFVKFIQLFCDFRRLKSLRFCFFSWMFWQQKVSDCHLYFSRNDFLTSTLSCFPQQVFCWFSFILFNFSSSRHHLINLCLPSFMHLLISNFHEQTVLCVKTLTSWGNLSIRFWLDQIAFDGPFFTDTVWPGSYGNDGDDSDDGY